MLCNLNSLSVSRTFSSDVAPSGSVSQLSEKHSSPLCDLFCTYMQMKMGQRQIDERHALAPRASNQSCAMQGPGTDLLSRPCPHVQREWGRSSRARISSFAASAMAFLLVL